ncbi:hypothetical protein HDU76_007466 [Blyttiomyces sp. JEL0837]|nr:hypothetical protein HDU76_007466 [Blyttiomyces sp. JEL0837]
MIESSNNNNFASTPNTTTTTTTSDIKCRTKSRKLFPSITSFFKSTSMSSSSSCSTAFNNNNNTATTTKKKSKRHYQHPHQININTSTDSGYSTTTTPTTPSDSIHNMIPTSTTTPTSQYRPTPTLKQQQYNMMNYNNYPLSFPSDMPTNEKKSRRALYFALTTSSLLDSYVIDRVVGFGSNGTVLAGRCGHNLEYKVAIKIIYKGKSELDQNHPQHQQKQFAHPFSTTISEATLAGSNTSTAPWTSCSNNNSTSSTSPFIKQQLPYEIALHKLLSSNHPHPNLLALYNHFEDSLHHYIVTELADTNWLDHLAEQMSSSNNNPNTDESTTTFEFINPRTGKLVSLRYMLGGSPDLWAWTIAADEEGKRIQREELEHQGFDVDEIMDTDLALPKVLPPLDSVKSIFIQTLSAVRHLHSLGIYHGDIKEENVLVTAIPTPSTSDNDDTIRPSTRSHLKVHLCDFGHARQVSTNSKNLNVMSSYGTPEMTSVELFPNLIARWNHDSKPKVYVNPFAADIFALGLLLYTLRYGPGKLPLMVEKIRERDVEALYSADKFGYLFDGDLEGYVGEEGGDRDGNGDREESLEQVEIELFGDLVRGMLESDPKWRLNVEEVWNHPWVQEGDVGE